MPFTLPSEALDTAASTQGQKSSGGFNLPAEAVDESVDPASYYNQDPSNERMDEAVKIAKARVSRPTNLLSSAAQFGEGVVKGIPAAVSGLAQGAYHVAQDAAAALPNSGAFTDAPLTDEQERARRELKSAVQYGALNGFEGIKDAANKVGSWVGLTKSDRDLSDDEWRDRIQHEAASKVVQDEISKGNLQGDWYNHFGTTKTPEELAAAGSPVRPDVVQQESFIGDPRTYLLDPAADLAGPLISKGITSPLLKTAGRGLEAATDLAGGIAKHPLQGAGLGYLLGHGPMGLGVTFAAKALKKVGPGISDALTQAGEEAAGAAPPVGQSLATKAFKAGTQGAVTGAALGVPYALAAKNPEEAGEAIGGGIGLGSVMGAFGGVKNARTTEVGAKANQLANQGAALKYGLGLDDVHNQWMQTLPAEAQKAINTFRGAFNGFTNQDGIPVQIYVAGGKDFQDAQGGQSANDPRGFITKHGTKIFLNADYIKAKGGTDEVLAHEAAGHLTEFLSGIYQGHQIETLQNDLGEAVKGNASFDRFIKNHTDALLGPNPTPERTAAVQRVIDSDPRYFEKEFLAQHAVEILKGKNIAEFSMPKSVRDNMVLGARRWLRNQGILSKSGGDIGWGGNEIKEITDQMRDILYRQGAKGEELRNAGEQSPSVALRMQQLEATLKNPPTQASTVEQLNAFNAAKAEYDKLQKSIGTPFPAAAPAPVAPSTPQAPPAAAPAQPQAPQARAAASARLDAAAALQTLKFKPQEIRDWIEKANQQHGSPITTADNLVKAALRIRAGGQITPGEFSGTPQTPAATAPTTPTAAPQPVSLTPALMIDGKPVAAQPGETHAALGARLKAGLPPGPERDAVNLAIANDDQHVFLDHNGNVLNRTDAGNLADANNLRDKQRAGKPLHSEMLASTHPQNNAPTPQPTTGEEIPPRTITTVAGTEGHPDTKEPPQVSQEDVDRIAAQAEQDVIASRTNRHKPETLPRAVTDAQVQAVAKAHEKSVPLNYEGIKLRKDALGKESITGKINPSRPFDSFLLKLADLSDKAKGNLLNLQNMIGKAVTVKYGHAPKTEGDVTGASRREAQKLSPAEQRASGQAETQYENKNFIPLEFKFNTGKSNESPSITVLGASPEKLLNNFNIAADATREIGEEVPYRGIHDPRYVADMKGVARNHRNGYKGDGSRKIEGFADVNVPKPDEGYTPYKIDPKRFEFLNLTLADEGAKTGKKGASPEQKLKQSLAVKNNIPMTGEGETNALREKINKAKGTVKDEYGGDTTWSKATLENPLSETLRVDLIDEIAPHNSDDASIRPHGYKGDVNRFFGQGGTPNRTFTAAGFMPGDERPLTTQEKARQRIEDRRKGTPNDTFVAGGFMPAGEPVEDTQKKVIAASIRLRDGTIINAPSHSLAYDKAHNEGKNIGMAVEGFTLKNGTFIDRSEASARFGGPTKEDVNKSPPNNSITDSDRDLLSKLGISGFMPADASGKEAPSDPSNNDRVALPQTNDRSNESTTASQARDAIVARYDKQLNSAIAKNKAQVEHYPAEDEDSAEYWDVSSKEEGNQHRAQILRDGDGFEVLDENDHKLSGEKTIDDAIQTARDHVESGDTTAANVAHAEARSEILDKLAIPEGAKLVDMQDTKWGSVYYKVRVNTGEDEEGEPEYKDYKISIRDHDPSPFREKEFGANDYWTEVPKNASPKQIADAVTRVEKWIARKVNATKRANESVR